MIDISGFIIAGIGAIGAICAAVIPLALTMYNRSVKVHNTIGQSNGQGSIVEMLEKQTSTLEKHGQSLDKLSDGQNRTNERLANLELAQYGIIKDFWAVNERVQKIEKKIPIKEDF